MVLLCLFLYVTFLFRIMVILDIREGRCGVERGSGRGSCVGAFFGGGRFF